MPPEELTPKQQIDSAQAMIREAHGRAVEEIVKDRRTGTITSQKAAIDL
jgi:hypothetical protein